MAHPACGVPTHAADSEFGLFEQDLDLRVGKHAIEAVERLVRHRRVEHDQGGFGLRSKHGGLIAGGRIGLQDDVRAGQVQRLAHAVAGRTGAGQQHDAAGVVIHGRA